MAVNIRKIAEYCRDIYEEYAPQKRPYVKTYFVCIKDDDTTLVSLTPHVLDDAKKAILIHEYSINGGANDYPFYNIEYINESGEVLKESLENGFQLLTNWIINWSDQTLFLKKNGKVIYSCKRPWRQTIQKLWDVYVQSNKCSTVEEAVILGKLAMKDDMIEHLSSELKEANYKNIYLQQERDLYKNTLDKLIQKLNT